MCYLGRSRGGVKPSTEVEILPQHRRVKTKVVGERGRREKQEASYGGSSMSSSEKAARQRLSWRARGSKCTIYLAIFDHFCFRSGVTGCARASFTAAGKCLLPVSLKANVRRASTCERLPAALTGAHQHPNLHYSEKIQLKIKQITFHARGNTQTLRFANKGHKLGIVQHVRQVTHHVSQKDA